MLSSGKKCNFFLFSFFEEWCSVKWLELHKLTPSENHFSLMRNKSCSFRIFDKSLAKPLFFFYFVLCFNISFLFYYIYIYKTSFFYFCFFALFLFRRSVGKTSGGTFLLFPSEAEHRKIAENVLRKTWQAFLFYILFFLRRWMEDVQQNLTCVIFWPGGWNTGKIYNQTMKRREKRKVPLPRLVFLFAASK